ncbi:cobalamin B12-binding domain-containing protein [Marinifilum caeruleilacunae]|uniref:Cobalamin-binding protein n=1 Tax=Marinifilum caeruleilacunae TaxID=2499076 RepID=A0ABX1WUK8_9BACT|nr:cobalamin-dependent protein [Marinifilum caeruleilacunae]NOU59786.1 cobalamin-binding protein [Marinifilum caeruleilacunae]
MTITTETYHQFINSLLLGDRNQCHHIINEHWEKQFPLLIIYEEMIKKAMYEVGDLWEANKISVATEHLSSGIIESILNDLQLKLKHSANKKNTVLTACVENEFHQIGIKMIGDVFEKNGWKSYFLGANTPNRELVKFASLIQPDVFAVSLSIYSHLPALEKLILAIRTKFPKHLIAVGGQAFRHGGEETIAQYENVVLLQDTFHTEKFIKTLSA